MNVVYRVTTPDDTDFVAYATNCASADSVAATIIDNGYRVRVQRMDRRNVPMNELELITELTN